MVIFIDRAYSEHQETEMLAVFTYADELGFEPGLNSPEHKDCMAKLEQELSDVKQLLPKMSTQLTTIQASQFSAAQTNIQPAATLRKQYRVPGPCYNSGKVGHFALQCPDPTASQGQTQATEPKTSPSLTQETATVDRHDWLQHKTIPTCHTNSKQLLLPVSLTGYW